ncbi:hypothetical protein, partial [Staphylococcus equorum]|uniref:hypothetical protein n=1 Tax=Staphylococcus equorum TaxID=246432 RepID=UPI0025560851
IRKTLVKSPTNVGRFKSLISLGRVKAKSYKNKMLALGTIMGGRSLPHYPIKFVKSNSKPKPKNHKKEPNPKIRSDS